MIQELIGLCDRYEPAFSQKIRGATPREIARLEKLAGRELLAVHREFLLSMGRETAGIHAPAADYGIELPLDFYARHGKS